MTRQREIISNIIAQSGKTHPTADEIFMQAKRIMPNIAVGTVYRNLNLLTASGEVRKISIPDAPDRYDRDLTRHDHLVCVKCSRLFDIKPRNIPMPDDLPGDIDILGADVLIKCVCGDCRRQP